MIKISNIPKGYLLLEDGDEIRADDLFSYDTDIKNLSTNLADWQTRDHIGTWRTGWFCTIRKAPPIKKKKLVPYQFKIGARVRVGSLYGKIYGRCRTGDYQLPVYLISLEIAGQQDPAVRGFVRTGFCYDYTRVKKIAA